MTIVIIIATIINGPGSGHGGENKPSCDYDMIYYIILVRT